MKTPEDWEQWFAHSRKAVRSAQSRGQRPASAFDRFNEILWQSQKFVDKKYPWRSNRTPYRVMVAEVMLQQTQADRVVPLYRGFLTRFPTLKKLACAPRADVIRHWQGLGYNRRALYLHSLAQEVAEHHGGRLPRQQHELEKLPGIGAYTSRSVLVFAFNEPHVFIETNIRSVFSYYFTSMKRTVSDRELTEYVAGALDQENPRDWYEAVMDVGGILKRTRPGLNSFSTGYKKQSPFEGSFRQKRGAIIRLLAEESPRTVRGLHIELGITRSELGKVLETLARDGFIAMHRQRVKLL